MSLSYGQDIICGEIDNREQGKVKGVFIFAGWEQCMKFELIGDLLEFGGQCLVFHNPTPKVMDNNHYIEKLDGEVLDLKLNKLEGIRFTFESESCGLVILQISNLQYVSSDKQWLCNDQDVKNKRKILKEKMERLEPQILLENQRKMAHIESSRGERKVIISRIRQMQAQLWMGDYKDEGESLQNLKSWEQHLQMLMDFEAKTLGLRNEDMPDKSFTPYPFILKPEVIISDKEIEFECWRLIYSLCACSIYLARTDHLNWRELYTVLMNEILDSGLEPLRLGHFNSMRHVDVVDLDENAQDLNLRYYAFLDERQCMEEEYGVELPPIEERLFDRDKNLPVRAGF